MDNLDSSTEEQQPNLLGEEYDQCKGTRFTIAVIEKIEPPAPACFCGGEREPLGMIVAHAKNMEDAELIIGLFNALYPGSAVVSSKENSFVKVIIYVCRKHLPNAEELKTCE